MAKSNSPSPPSMRQSPKRRLSNCGIPWCRAPLQDHPARPQGVHAPIPHERRKPALGQYGELTVEQARVMA